MPDGTWIKGSAKVTLHDQVCFAMDPGTPIQAYVQMKEIVARGLSGRTCGYEVRKNIQDIPSAHLRTVITCLVLQVHARVTSPREAPPMEAKANWMPQSKEVAYNIWGALDIDRY